MVDLWCIIVLYDKITPYSSILIRTRHRIYEFIKEDNQLKHIICTKQSVNQVQQVLPGLLELLRDLVLHCVREMTVSHQQLPIQETLLRSNLDIEVVRVIESR